MIHTIMKMILVVMAIHRLCFRKCIGDKSATLNLKPHQTWRTAWMALKGTWRTWMFSGTLTWVCNRLAVWKLRSAALAKCSIFATHDLWFLHLRCFFWSFGLDFAIFWFSFSCLFFQATATWKERSSSSSKWCLGFTLHMRFLPPLQWACHCCSPGFHLTPLYGTFGWNTGSAHRVFTAFTWRCCTQAKNCAWVPGSPKSVSNAANKAVSPSCSTSPLRSSCVQSFPSENSKWQESKSDIYPFGLPPQHRASTAHIVFAQAIRAKAPKRGPVQFSDPKRKGAWTARETH